jgi:hypothetical protein
MCERCGATFGPAAWSNQRLLLVLLPGNQNIVVCGRCHRPGEPIVQVLAS